MSKIKIVDLSSKPILKDLDNQDTRHIFGGRHIDPEPGPDPEPPGSCWGGECRDRKMSY